MEAIRLVREALPGVVADPGDLGLRARMMLGSLQAGLAFSNAILGAVHAMAHSLGGLLDLPPLDAGQGRQLVSPRSAPVGRAL